MDHKRYEDWILSDEILPPGDRRALIDHLNTCHRCLRLEKSWRLAQHRLGTAGLAAPAPGFSARWAARLEHENVRTRRRHSLATVFAAAGAGSLAVMIFGVRILGAMAEFAVMGMDWLSGMSGWTSALAQAAFSAATSATALTDAAPALFMPPAIMLLFAAVGTGAVVWLKMFRLLARVQGFTQWA